MDLLLGQRIGIKCPGLVIDRQQVLLIAGSETPRIHPLRDIVGFAVGANQQKSLAAFANGRGQSVGSAFKCATRKLLVLPCQGHVHNILATKHEDIGANVRIGEVRIFHGKMKWRAPRGNLGPLARIVGKLFLDMWTITQCVPHETTKSPVERSQRGRRSIGRS